MAKYSIAPYKLNVTRMPLDAADVLASQITSVFDSTPGVLGPDDVARNVAQAIAAKNGGKVAEGEKSRIYELRKVLPPRVLPGGKMRAAQPGETDLLIEWLETFARETHHGRDDARAFMQAHLGNKTAFVWDDDGPKASAVWAGIMPHGVRVGFVFTPAEHRGRGYASAITAAVSQRALDSGYEFCCLYTDLSNPTSNSIYQKIGYTPVCDAVDYAITA
jgi:predicted GNAT family acetyltransferase